MLHSFEILVARGASSSLSSGRCSWRKIAHSRVTASFAWIMMSESSSTHSDLTWKKMDLTLAWKSESAYDRPTMVRAWASVQHKLNIARAYASPLALKMPSARQQHRQSIVVQQIKLTELAFTLLELGGALSHHACDVAAGTRQDGHKCKFTKQNGLVAQAGLVRQGAAYPVLQYCKPKEGGVLHHALVDRQ